MKDSRTNAKEEVGEGTFPHLLAGGIQIGPATLEIRHGKLPIEFLVRGIQEIPQTM